MVFFYFPSLLFFLLSFSFFFRSFVSRGREPTTSPIELSITSEWKKRDERIRTSERRSTFVQGDFQLSGISRWNAWKAKSQWSLIDFYEGRKRERERDERKRRRRRRSNSWRARKKRKPDSKKQRRIFHFDETFATRWIREDKRRRETCCVRAPRKIISALHTYPRWGDFARVEYRGGIIYRPDSRPQPRDSPPLVAVV